MRKILIYKVFSDCDEYGESKIVELINGEQFREVSEEEYTDILRKIFNFNRCRYRLYPTPEFSLAYVEYISPETLDELFDSVAVIVNQDMIKREKDKEKNDKKKEADAKRRESSAATRKREQYEKLKEEFGDK